MSRLFKITTERDSGWSSANPKPCYVIAGSKDDAKGQLSGHLADGLRIKSVAELGRSVSNVMFIPE